MTEDVIKHLKVGDKIVRINTHYNYFGDDSTMQEEWYTIEDINERQTVYFCRDWKKRVVLSDEIDKRQTVYTCRDWKKQLVLFDDKQILSFSTTTLSAYENALERLKKQNASISKKIILCETMITDLEKENEEDD